MTKKNNITEIVFILDRSGSMAGLEKDTIGGFNAMIEKQKKLDGKAYVSTVLFDHESIVLHDRLPLEQIEPMTENDYTVRGCTALLDAMGDSMSVLRKGTNYIGDIDGASIIGCNQLPMWRADVANNLPKRFLVMVLNTKAIQFVDEMIINEKMKDKDQYGFFYRTLNILDWMVDYPELMGYGIVTLG